VGDEDAVDVVGSEIGPDAVEVGEPPPAEEEVRLAVSSPQPAPAAPARSAAREVTTSGLRLGARRGGRTR